MEIRNFERVIGNDGRIGTESDTESGDRAWGQGAADAGAARGERARGDRRTQSRLAIDAARTTIGRQQAAKSARVNALRGVQSDGLTVPTFMTTSDGKGATLVGREGTETERTGAVWSTPPQTERRGPHSSGRRRQEPACHRWNGHRSGRREHAGIADSSRCRCHLDRDAWRPRNSQGIGSGAMPRPSIERGSVPCARGVTAVWESAEGPRSAVRCPSAIPVRQAAGILSARPARLRSRPSAIRPLATAARHDAGCVARARLEVAWRDSRGYLSADGLEEADNGSRDCPTDGKRAGFWCAVCGVRCAVCGVRCAVCGVRLGRREFSAADAGQAGCRPG